MDRFGRMAGEGQHEEERNGGCKIEGKGISFAPNGGFQVLDFG